MMIEYPRHTVIATVTSRKNDQRGVLSSQASRPVYFDLTFFNSVFIAELPGICLAL